MNAATIKNVRLAGLAAAIPRIEECSLKDLDLTEEEIAAARRWNWKPFRRKAKMDQCQSDFCLEAARKLMGDLGWQPSEIDVVVMTTLTPDYSIPATSIILQDRLGIPKTAVAFDLPSGEIGFLHGLQTAASMISAGFLKKALLLTGKASKAPGNRSFDAPFRPIYGDCGSVCALEYSEGSPEMVFASGGDGSEFRSLYLPIGGVRNPVDPKMFETAEGAKFAREYMRDYGKLDATAREEVPACVRRVLEGAKKTIRDLDACYFSPLSFSIEDGIRATLGIPRDKFHSEIPDIGGCASGAIPLTMLARGMSRLREGRRASLLAGFGAGPAWGAAVVTTENLVCPDFVEM